MDTNKYFEAGYEAGLKAIKGTPTFYYELADWAKSLADQVDDIANEVVSVEKDYTKRGSSNNGFDSGTTIDGFVKDIIKDLQAAVNKLDALSSVVKSTNE